MLTRIINASLKERFNFKPGPGRHYSDQMMIGGSSTKGKDLRSNLRFKGSARIWEMKRSFKAEKKGD